VRALALFPASFFLLALVVNLRAGTLHNLVWVCNVMNVALAASLALAWPRGIWLATLWLVVGSPLWLWDAFETGVFEAHSFLTHVAATGVGLVALRRIPRPRHLWWQAVLVGIALQLAARALTTPEHNVNVAFAAYAPLARALPALAAWFPLAAAANVAVFGATMLALEALLARVSRS
jgi:hypothetical protein